MAECYKDETEELKIPDSSVLSAYFSDSVRLINGTDQCSGRLEVKHGGQWGKVCKNNWGLKEATIVCKELNCGAPKKSQDSFSYGESGLRGYMSTCSGNVSSISQCTLQEQAGTCEGVSLSCAGKTLNVPQNCSPRMAIENKTYRLEVKQILTLVLNN